jgi:hypothetical protein
MILLIVDHPFIEPNSYQDIVINKADRIISIIFWLEAFCRIIALGFFHNS